VATIVIGSHGVRGVTDASPANHYSLLSTIQHTFGLGCLQFTCDTKHVQPLTKLVAVTGSKSVVSTPVSTSASVMLEGVAVSGGQVWVDGEADSADAGRPIIEHLQNGHWSTANLSGVGSIWTMLYGIAVTGDTVWATGTFVNPVTDNNEVLVLRGVNGHWSVDPVPNPGSGSNILEGVTMVGGQLWVAGVYDTGGSRLPLIEHR
jgi:hypothetical protein